MRHYHPLSIVARAPLAEDAVEVQLAVPEALIDTFRGHPGQHVPVRAVVDGDEVRRTYTLVPTGRPDRLALGVRVQGLLSRHLAALPLGTTLEAMPPGGRWRVPAPGASPSLHVAFAAGSGITPVLATLEALLDGDPLARAVLYYGNRTLASSMYVERLMNLKNRHLGRLTLHWLMSREPQAVERQHGRLDAPTVRRWLAQDLDPQAVSSWSLCGPDTMVRDVSGLLRELRVPGHIQTERFAAPRAAAPAPAATAAAPRAGIAVAVRMDGRERRFTADPSRTLLEAAEGAGLRLPFSCRAGICSTCRVRVTEGAVTMDRNQALEPWEVEAGYALCCQARATTATIGLSYDET